MSSLRIAFVTPEAVPFAKTGGLADVSGALTKTLAEMGHSVKLFMPKYRQVSRTASNMTRLDFRVKCRIGEAAFEGDVFYLPGAKAGLEVYFIGNDYFFDRSELYRDPETKMDYNDNDERFIFFCKAVMQTVKNLGWTPDVIHANDWQSALVPAFLKTSHKGNDLFRNTRSVFTIHNMGFQGKFPADTFQKLGLDSSYFRAAGPFEFWDDVNFMKSAIYFADRITTVSPTYANEIQLSDEYGKGLHGVLKSRSDHLSGVLNGVDYNIWSPKRDGLIPYRYYPGNLSGKKKNKLELLRKCGFPIRMEHPLIGVVSRLDVQKGFDLLEEIIDDVLSLDIQFVLLGTGDERYHLLFQNVEQRYRDKFRAFLEFDNRLAHLIEAGADMFLMPSRYEPCGLNQLYSLKYGTVPIVRKTGGLADTVIDFDEDSLWGTGFVFEKYESGKLLKTIRRAVSLFSRKRVWHKIVKQGMSQDFSWQNSARKYTELYFDVLDSADH